MLTASKLTTEKQIIQHLPKILTNLGIEYIDRKDRLAFACPIHGSDTSESLTIYLNGNTRVGNFVCWSHHCEETIGDSCVELLKYIIEQRKGISFSYKDTLDIICELAQSDISLTPIVEIEKNIEEEAVDITSCKTKIALNDTLSFPAKYFIQRGFSKEILDYFNVGFCNTRGQEMFMRSVVPIFDISEKYVLGLVGRSINEQCPVCKKYHYSKNRCPDEKAAKFYNKWINSRGFYSGGYFYGLCKNFRAISNREAVVLVEGAGDCWRLKEAGCDVGLGLFGDKITFTQYNILKCLGVKDVIIATDSDEPGAEARYRIRNKLIKDFNVFDLFWQEKDCGLIPSSIVKRKLKKEFPWLES